MEYNITIEDIEKALKEIQTESNKYKKPVLYVIAKTPEAEKQFNDLIKTMENDLIEEINESAVKKMLWNIE